MPMNIIYREAETSDAGKFLEYCKIVGAESDNLTFGAEGIPFTISQEADFIRKFAGNPDSVMLVAFDEGELVGTGAVSSISGKNRFAHRRDIAISIRKDYWGKGIMTEAVKRIIRYSFDELKIDLLSAFHYSENLRSKRVIEKCGFEYEITLYQSSKRYDDKVMDMVCYCILKDNYYKV